MTRSKQVLILAVLVGVAVAGAIAAEPQTIKMEGSTTVGPIADAYVEAFKKMYPDVTITVNKSGSGNGAAALVDSRCDIANLSRFMKEQEFKDAVAKGVLPVAHAIAMDGVCVIVHPSNPVTALTTAQVRDIYTGKVTNWKELGGADQKIVVVSRDTSSGTYETFESLVMAKQKMASGVQYVASNPESHAAVKSTAGAVAYVGLGFIDKDVKALKIDGVMPSRKTIAKGEYPVSRPLFMFTNGYPKLGSLIHALVTFHLTPKGQDIIDAKGFVPVTEY
jgi:phosphate transport system substrate-binding protein